MINSQTIFLQAASYQQFILPLAFIAVLYFFMILPQVRKQKKEKKFQAELKQGTQVVTTSGIHGRIAEVNTKNNINCPVTNRFV